MSGTAAFQVIHNGARLAGESCGAGEAVVFLHAGVADRRMWRRQVTGLGERWRTVAYDRRGFGATVCSDVPFAHVDDLAAVLDHGGISSACLVGCSQGGRVAIDFTLAHPQRVDALVLVAPAVSGAPVPDSHGEVVDATLAELEAAEAAGDLTRVNTLEAHLWLDGPGAMEGRVKGPARDLLLEMNAAALRHPALTGEAEPPSAYARLSELAVPALVIWGALDFPYIRSRCRHLVEAMTRARGMELENTAHLPSLEQPDRLNVLLREFLSDRCAGRIPRPGG